MRRIMPLAKALTSSLSPHFHELSFHRICRTWHHTRSTNFFHLVFGDSFSPLTGDDLTSQVASHISTEQKDAFDKIGSVQGCYPGAKGLWFSSTGKTSASFDVSLNVRTAIRAKVKAYRHQPSSEDTLYIGGSPYVPTSSSVTTEFTINASTGSYINYLSFAFNSADKNMYIYSIMFFK